MIRVFTFTSSHFHKWLKSCLWKDPFNIILTNLILWVVTLFNKKIKQLICSFCLYGLSTFFSFCIANYACLSVLKVKLTLKITDFFNLGERRSGLKKDDEDAEGCWGCSCSAAREVARFVRAAVRQVRACHACVNTLLFTFIVLWSQYWWSVMTI